MIIILAAIIYLLIGIFVSAAAKEKWESLTLLILLLWPVIVVGVIIFAVVNAICSLGEDFGRWIRDNFGK